MDLVVFQRTGGPWSVAWVVHSKPTFSARLLGHATTLMLHSSRSQRITWASSIPVALALALATVSGCRNVDPAGPLHDDASFEYLEREVSSALEALETLTCVQHDATQQEAYTSARRALYRLRDYHVPLLEALMRADRASRWLQSSEDDLALEELALIEVSLLTISDQGDVKLSEEIDRPLELVVTARAAIRAHRAEAPELVHDLRTRIHQLLHKSGLVLQGTYLEPDR